MKALLAVLTVLAGISSVSAEANNPAATAPAATDAAPAPAATDAAPAPENAPAR